MKPSQLIGYAEGVFFWKLAGCGRVTVTQSIHRINKDQPNRRYSSFYGKEEGDLHKGEWRESAEQKNFHEGGASVSPEREEKASEGP